VVINGGTVMLQRVSPEARDLYVYAEDCRRKAEIAPTDESRQELLRLHRSWMNLGHSFEAAEYLLGLRKVS
jgi:hypothetical protein